MRLIWLAAGLVTGISFNVRAADLTEKIQAVKPVAVERFLANISRPDTQPGFVVASPSREEPNYYFHWVRDAALTMQALQDLLEREQDSARIAALEQTLFDFAAFSRRNQLTPTLSVGYGEPKFNPDGSGYSGDWGRPQSDGAALRALTLIRFARRLLQDPHQQTYVRTFLYDSRYPTDSVIKADLEYVAHHWRDPSYDLWEEVKGDHFYTHMAHRSALVAGAKLAEDLGDRGAAAFYRAQAKNLEHYLSQYWDSHRRLIRATLNYKGGVDYKHSNIDSAVLLSLMHADIGDGFMKLDDDKVLSTVARIEEAFKNLYPINHNGFSVPGIGRYPEDRYDGLHTHTIGNPWFITTFAMAEFHYRLAKELEKNPRRLRRHRFFNSLSRRKPLPDAIREKGDAYMRRALHHINQDDYSMSEQYNRYTGHMQGAHDLTWSYASFLTASFAR